MTLLRKAYNLPDTDCCNASIFRIEPNVLKIDFLEKKGNRYKLKHFGFDWIVRILTRPDKESAILTAPKSGFNCRYSY